MRPSQTLVESFYNLSLRDFAKSFHVKLHAYRKHGREVGEAHSYDPDWTIKKKTNDLQTLFLTISLTTSIAVSFPSSSHSMHTC